VNFLRITCASCKALPDAGFRLSRKVFFTAHGAVSILFIGPIKSPDLTIAVLGKLALWTYYPDTLLAQADENSTEAAQ
jgi:hypothetical protein